MKRSIFLLGCLTMLLASCTNKSYTVKGEAPEGVEYVYLCYNYFESEQTIDSIAVAEDGTFTLNGDGEKPKIVAGAYDNGVQIWFITEPGEILVGQDGTPSGTPLNEAITQFSKSIAESDGNYEEIVKNFMAEHNNDLAGLFCLLMSSDLLGINTTAELLNDCSNEVKEEFYNVIPQEKIDLALATVPGKMFIDFEVEYEGEVQRLSDYVGNGKYVLVDFWASWCGPCRGEIPTLIKVYDEYAGDNFTVLGVATWDKPEDTQAAIEELGITYPQIMNAQKIGSGAYSINGIPEIILFGPDGTILERGLRGEAIVSAVENALK